MPPGGSEVLIKARLVQNITQEAASMAHALDTITKSATSMAQQMGAGAFAKLNAVTKEVTDAQGNMQRVLVGNIKVFGQAEAATKAQEAATKIATAAIKQKEAAEKKAADAAAKHAQAVSTAQGAIKSTGADVGAINQRFGELGNRYVLTRDAAGQLTAKVKQASVTLDEQGNIVQKTNKSWIQYMTGVFGGIGLYTIASSALRTVRSAMNEVGAAAIGLNAMLETNRMAFTQFLGSTQAADTMLKDLFQFAAVTPFQFPEVVDASKKIMAFGFAAEEVIPTLTAIGNATAGLGSGAVGIERITLALGQMAAKGKVQGQELRQLGEAGIRVQEVLKMVADKMGISLSEVIALQETGGLKAKEFIDAFMQYVKIKFGDMMMQQAKTFTGAMSTIKDITQMTIAQAFEPLFKILSKKAYNVAVFMQTKEFQSQAIDIKNAVAGIIDAFMKLAGVIKDSIIPVLASLVFYLGGSLLVAANKLSFTIQATGATVKGFQAVLLTAQSGLDKFLLGMLTNPILLLAAAVGVLALTIVKLKENYNEAIVIQQNFMERHRENAKFLGDEASKYVDLAQKISDYNRVAEQFAFLWGNAPKTDLWKPQDIKDAEAALAIYNQRILATQTSTLAARDSALSMAGAAYNMKDAMNFAPIALANTVAMRGQSKAMSENRAQTDTLRTAYKDTFDKLITGWITAGDVSYDAGQEMYKAFGLTASDNFKTALDTINSKMKDLDTNAQLLIGRQLGDIFKKMESGAIGSTEALELLLPVLAQVEEAAKKAADVKRWQELGAAIAAGAGGQIFAGVDIQTKEIGELIPQSQIDEEKAKLKGLGAEWEIQAEKIRRAMGTSTEKNLNWTQPLKEGSAVLIDMQSDLDKIVQKQTEVNGKVAEWGAWNAAAGDRAAAGYEKAMAALGNFMAKQVLSKQVAGEISDKQAEALYKAYETVFGAALSNEDKLTLALTKSSKEFKGLGIAGQAAYGLIIAQAQKTFLQMGKTDAATEKATKNATIDSKMWATQIGMLQDAYKNLGPAAEPIIANIVQKALEAKDPYTELVRLVAEATKDFGGLKKEVEGTWTGFTPTFAKGVEDKDFLKDQEEWAKDARDKFATDAEDAAEAFIAAFTGKFKDETDKLAQAGQDAVAGVAAGMTSPTAQAILQTATATVAGWLPQWVKDLLGIKSPSTVFADIGSQIPAGLAQGVNQGAQEPVAAVANLAQRLIDVIGNISVDPRVKDKVDIIRGVLDAFKTGLDALAGMGTYTGKGIENIGKAFSEMQEIIGRFGTLFSGGADYENMQKFGDAMRSILDGFKAGIDALVAMGDYVSPARERVDQFITDVLYITNRLASAATIIDTGMGDLMSSIGDGIGSMVEPLMQLRDYTGLVRDATTGIAPALEAFQKDFFGFIGRLALFARWIAEREGLAEKMKILGDTLESVMSSLKDAVDVLVGIGTRTPFSRIKGIAPILSAFQDDLFGLVGRLAYLANWITQQRERIAQMKALGEVLNGLFSPLKDAIDVLTSLTDYRGLTRLRSGIAPALVSFQADLQGLVGRLAMLAEWLRQQGRGSDFKAMGESLGSIFGALGSALDIITKIADLSKAFLTTTSGFDATLIKVGQILEIIYLNLNDWRESQYLDLPHLEDIKDYATKLGEMIAPVGNIFSVISSLIDFVKKGGGITVSEADNALIMVGLYLERIYLNLNDWRDSQFLDIPHLEDIKGYASLLNEVISPVNSIISTVSSLLDYIKKGYAAVSPSALDAALINMGGYLEIIYQSLNDWRESQYLSVPNLEGIKSYAALLAEVLSPLSAIISITSSMLDFAKKASDNFGSLDYALSVMQTVAEKLVLKIGQWADPNGPFQIPIPTTADNPLAAYAKALSELLSPMSTVISITSSAIDLADKVGTNSLNLDRAMVTMQIAAERLVLKVKQWMSPGGPFQIIIGAVENNPLVAYAEALSKVLSPLSTIMSVTSGAIDLATKVGTDFINFDRAMMVMQEAASRLVLKVKQWYAPGGPFQIIIGAATDNPLVAFAETLSKILSPMSTIISVTSSAIDLATKLGDDFTGFDRAMIIMQEAATHLILKIKQWYALGGDFQIIIGEAKDNPLLAFAELLSKILSPMATIISVTSGMVDLAEKVKDGFTPIYNAIAAMEHVTKILIDSLRIWSVTIANLIGEAKDNPLVALGELLAKVLSPMSTVVGVISSMIDLSDKLAEKTYDWADISSKIKDAIYELMTYWKDLASGDFATWLASFPEDFSKNLQNALSPITTATGALNALVEWSDKLANKIHNWDGIVYQLSGYIYQVLMRWQDLANDPLIKEALKKFTTEFATGLNNAFGPIKTAIDALNAIKNYTGMLRGAASRIPTAVQALANDVAAFMEAFAEATKNIVVGDQITKFGNALQAIIAPVKTYLDTFYLLWLYQSIWKKSGNKGAQPANYMPAQFDALAGDIKLLVTRMAALLADPAFQNAVSTAEELADGLDPIMSFIKNSMDFMKDLLSYSKAGNKGNLQDFLDDFANAMTTLVSWFDVMNPMIQRLTSAIEGTGFSFGVSLIDAMILGLGSRQSALAAAILQLINRSLPAVGGLQLISTNMKVSMEPTVPTVTQGATSVNFNGPIYVSKPADIDAIAEKVSRVLGPKAYQTAKVVVQGN